MTVEGKKAARVRQVCRNACSKAPRVSGAREKCGGDGWKLTFRLIEFVPKVNPNNGRRVG